MKSLYTIEAVFQVLFKFIFMIFNLYKIKTSNLALTLIGTTKHCEIRIDQFCYY